MVGWAQCHLEGHPGGRWATSGEAREDAAGVLKPGRGKERILPWSPEGINPAQPSFHPTKPLQTSDPPHSERKNDTKSSPRAATGKLFASMSLGMGGVWRGRGSSRWEGLLSQGLREELLRLGEGQCKGPGTACVRRAGEASGWSAMREGSGFKTSLNSDTPLLESRPNLQRGRYKTNKFWSEGILTSWCL